MTWEIVLGIIALAGFMITVGGVVFKLSAALATLNTTIGMLRDTIKDLRDRSHETHRAMYAKFDEHAEQLADHEGRIRNLEDRRNYNDKK